MPTPADPPLAAVSPADLALVRAVRSWGWADRVGLGPDVPLWRRFSPAYRDRLAEAWQGTARTSPELAWETLLQDHVAAARPDLQRVHPSWLDRILRVESPAVRHLVARQRPGTGLGVGAGATVPPGANPTAVAWALTLWAERLVGDVPATPDDPAIVLALSSFGFRHLVRLAQAAGQVKLAFALAATPGLTLPDDPTTRSTPADRVRIAFFRRVIGRADPRLIPLARADIAAVSAPSRRKHAAVGLITFARLMKGCPPYRGRWALQHIPYPVARLVGTLGEGEHLGRSGLPPRAVRGWEGWVLKAAWGRLLSEGRLSLSPGGVWS